jgi:curved DNA-binding protein CbpA
MSSGSGAAGRNAERVPRLAPDCDPTRLDLSPEEGFLLSRIDGHTSQALLSQLTGLSGQQVDDCLRHWTREGVVLVGVSEPPAKEPSNGAAVPPPRGEPPVRGEAPAIDPDLDISAEQQEEILAFQSRLERPYHEILGVPADADTRAIKRAYFALSKEFHPDRYFQREIGPFQPMIERVFRKIVEAYELLSDPTVRAEIERSLGAETADIAEPVAEETPAAAGEAPRAPRKPRRRPLSPFSPLGRLMAQRKAKAKGFFESAMAAGAEERWLEATGSLRLAIAFDPHNATYRERFGEVQPRAHKLRFEALMKEADNAFSFRDRADALRIYEEALHYQPYDPQANHIAAKLAWLVAEDLRKAKEYALLACEADPEKAEYHRTLGQIYQAAGLKANARRELKLAVRLDPKDLEAKTALKSL